MGETAVRRFRITLPELERHQCKWPVEENRRVVGGFLFCGHRRMGEGPYCDKHARLAYTSQAARAAAAQAKLAAE
jgi:GcrA cell cycle regulator